MSTLFDELFESCLVPPAMATVIEARRAPDLSELLDINIRLDTSRQCLKSNGTSTEQLKVLPSKPFACAAQKTKLPISPLTLCSSPRYLLC
jgi:hypothetical protein